jgi:hypothetical protein
MGRSFPDVRMTRPLPSTFRRGRRLPDPCLRHLWLASLGGLVVAQRAIGAAARLARHEVERKLRRSQAS